MYATHMQVTAMAYRWNDERKGVRNGKRNDERNGDSQTVLRWYRRFVSTDMKVY